MREGRKEGGWSALFRELCTQLFEQNIRPHAQILQHQITVHVYGHGIVAWCIAIYGIGYCHTWQGYCHIWTWVLWHGVLPYMA